MWNVFKFFFVWFWLCFLGTVMLVISDLFRLGWGTSVHPSGAGMDALLVMQLPYLIIGGFLLCVPSYFIARPKRHRNSASVLDHPY